MLIATYLNHRVQAQQKPTPEKHAFSIQQCIDFAHVHNVQVKNALIDYQIQVQTNRGITAGALPSINGSISSTYFPNIPVQVFPNFISAATYGVLVQEGVKNGSGQPITSPSDFGYVSAAFGSKWNASAGVSLTQVVFDGQVFVGLQARRASLDYAQKSAALTEEGIKVNIYKIYYQLAVSKTQMEQLDANLVRAEKLLHDSKALFDNGFQEKIEVDKASVQLANLNTQKLKLQSNIDNGYTGLKYLLGMPISDTLVLTDKVTEEDIKDDLLQTQEYNYSDRKDFQVLTLANDLNRFNVKRYKFTNLPTVNLSSNFAKQAYRNTFSYFGKGDWFSSWNIGLSINVSIFNGFQKQASLKKAQLQFQQTQNQLEYLKIGIDNDVVQAQNVFHESVLATNYQKKNMELAEQVYNQAKKKYETGVGSNFEVTSAQSDLITAQTNYVSALYDAITAKIDYLKAIGKLK